MDCAEGEDVNLPCNHSTIGGDDYIHWYLQNPSQSPQYVIHGLRGTVNSSTASLHIASDRKSSTLVLPQVTLRDTTVYSCILREAHWDRWGCTCVVSLWWEEWRGGQSWGSCHKSKSRVIWKEDQKSSKTWGKWREGKWKKMDKEKKRKRTRKKCFIGWCGYEW